MIWLSPEVGALHRVSSGEELREPAEQRRLPVRHGRLRHGSGGEQGGGAHGGHRRLAVSAPQVVFLMAFFFCVRDPP